MLKRKNCLKREEGFTLIEIIAVLIILGILAAIAVPKYFELTTNAQNRAIAAAAAEIQARINLSFADQLVTENGNCTAAAANIDTTNILTDTGDFSVTGTINVTPGATSSLGFNHVDAGYSGSQSVTTPNCN